MVHLNDLRWPLYAASLLCLMAASSDGVYRALTRRSVGDGGGRPTSSVDAPCSPASMGLATEGRPTPAQVRSLAGRFDLLVFTTDSARVDTVTEGALVLSPTDSVHRTMGFLPAAPRHPSFVLSGYTTAVFDSVAPLRVSPASTDVDAPGVQVIQDGTIVIGNPTTANGAAFDMGVYLRVHVIADWGFAGTWASGSYAQPQAHGRFCASRTTPT